jgi:2-polyprenyl-3-methyl-5-hydroxy-6-metoxy-1,4-benzoquinol methylase
LLYIEVIVLMARLGKIRYGQEISVPIRPDGRAVNENVTAGHYARLAAAYDENWAYSAEFVAWMTRCIQQRLRITGTDQVIDIGCGTGLYARELALDAAHVVCADSSAPMLAQLPHDGRLTAVKASAEDLASGRVRLPADRFDAMLLKEVVHHVGDQGSVIGGLARLLKPGGRMLVVMLPATISYPLFAAALELFARQQPDPADIAAQMQAAGLDAELAYESFRWCSRLSGTCRWSATVTCRCCRISAMPSWTPG